ncbi:MAG TPA: hypothetical protein VFD92_07405 [Candidatus Binatia bacterium]|nr:hypothetical protein [Candidatus Binatia bacterium]
MLRPAEVLRRCAKAFRRDFAVAALVVATAAAAVATAATPASALEVPGVAGDQLLFVFDNRVGRQTYLLVTNPASEAIAVELVAYGSSGDAALGMLGSTSVRLTGGRTEVVDPSVAIPGASGNAGVIVVTPFQLDLEGQQLVPIVPPVPILGAFTLATGSSQSAFGENAFGRRAVLPGGPLASAGATVDGVSVRYEAIHPSVLAIPGFFNPGTPGASVSNRVVLVAFADDYGPPFRIRPPSSPAMLTGRFCVGGSVQIDVEPMEVSGVSLTTLEDLVGGGDDSPLDASGSAYFSVAAGDDANVLGVFAQSLGTYAAGERMPAALSTPACQPTPTPTPPPPATPTPSPTPFCGDNVWVRGVEQCDRDQLGEIFPSGDTPTCQLLVGLSCSSGAVKCTSACKWDVSDCVCECPNANACRTGYDCLGGVCVKTPTP